jgi:hypothetical protein
LPLRIGSTGAIALAVLSFMVPGARHLVDNAVPKAPLFPITLETKRTARLVFEVNAQDCANAGRALCIARLDKRHRRVGDAEPKGARILR